MKPVENNIELVYEVIINTDEVHEKSLGLFWTQAEALAASRGTSWYGGDGRVTTVSVIMVKVSKDEFKYYRLEEVEIFESLKDATTAKLKRSALAKLTEEEKKVLGL